MWDAEPQFINVISMTIPQPTDSSVPGFPVSGNIYLLTGSELSALSSSLSPGVGLEELAAILQHDQNSIESIARQMNADADRRRELIRLWLDALPQGQ